MTSDADDCTRARLGPLQLHRHDIAAAGRRWLIDAVRDQDALLAAAESFDTFPYGLLLWDSAAVLADALAGLGRLDGQRALELGAGVGLVGLAARHLGARVVQTDHSAEALTLAGANAVLNGIGGIEQVTADWTSWTPPSRFDLIAGSDILYDEAAHAAIARILDAGLAASGLAMLGDPGRTATPRFIERMRDAGWRVALATRRVPALHPTQPGQYAAISILTLRRAAAPD